MKLMPLLLATLSSALALHAAAATNLIVNGSFEDVKPHCPVAGKCALPSAGSWAVYGNGYVDGWSTSIGPGIEIDYDTKQAAADTNAVAENGRYLVELDSDYSRNIGGYGKISNGTNSNMWQDVKTTVGQEYELTFWYSPRPGPKSDSTFAASSEGIAVDFGGDKLTVKGSGEGLKSTHWTEETLFLKANSTNTLVDFQAIGTADSYGGLIDNVSVYDISKNCGPVPEPETYALFGLGALAVLLRRRKA